ncbi:MAG TPA: hypothetical protein VMW66_02685 [Elusimicrobiales bacterium]|nr:hypothetical protein [Elusimicrobiales bacterium]
MASNFKVLHEIGNIAATEGSEIKFSIDEYRKYTYASIRKYLKRQSYSGPTRSGITMNKEIVKGVLEALKQLPLDAQVIEEKELGKFAKRPGFSVVVRLTTYQGSKGIDFRVWQEGPPGGYAGWTKSGIRLPYKNLKEIIEYLEKIKDLMPDTEQK